VDALLKTALQHPVLIWAGHPTHTHEQAYQLFQKLLCPAQGCGACITCLQILQRQHPSLVWHSPEKQYLVEHIDQLLAQLAFSLEPHQHRFMVLDRADTLTPATANRLLKSLEEPPPGYHFLLLTQAPQALLATIRSRGILHTWSTPTTPSDFAPYVALFTQPLPPHPTPILELLETMPLTERETMSALDDILEAWIARHRHELQAGTPNPATAQRIAQLLQLAEAPPMAGSAKLFWRNLYLQWDQAL